ncbi:MAG: indolepyruvate ferredoxin oxidoreductase subunit alpha [Bacillota bacterium]
MAHFIGEECISCGSCASQCPAECISEGTDRYTIDSAVCTDCGSCAQVCPVEAIAKK